jgi:phosphoserine aminotransferase
MSVHRIYNFSAGPAVLPLPVLEEAQRDLVALPGVGMSILEISHRSRPFDEIIQGAEADMRTLAGIPANYKVLFLQGGASLQFSMVPMNLLTSGATADYVITGDWAKKALKEAKKIGSTSVAATAEAGNFKEIPAQADLRLTPGAAYAHMTSNNTIHGTEWPYVPDTGAAPLVCDMSSDMYSRPIDISRYGLIYAGAQKNLGPSGVTVVISPDLLADRRTRARC